MSIVDSLDTWLSLVIVTTQQAPLAETLVIVREMWSQISFSHKYLGDPSSHKLDATQPFVGADCTENYEITGKHDGRSQTRDAVDRGSNLVQPGSVGWLVYSYTDPPRRHAGKSQPWDHPRAWLETS